MVSLAPKPVLQPVLRAERSGAHQESKEAKKSKKQLKAEETARINEEKKAGQKLIDKANTTEDIFVELKVRSASCVLSVVSSLMRWARTGLPKARQAGLVLHLPALQQTLRRPAQLVL